MIKTIISTSDFHLRPLKRHDEYKKAFNNFIADVKEKKPDRVVLVGDLFHSKITVSNEAYAVLSKLLNALSKYTKIIIIPGNHDAIIDSERLDSISPIIDMMNNPNIIYYKNSGCFKDKWDSEVVWCVWSCLENQKRPEIKEWKSENDENNQKHYIGLYHGVINGSKTPTGFTFVDEGVDTREFYHTDLLLAGDIHLYQTYEYENYKGSTTGIMCGSFIQQNFGEFTENHGYISLEYKNNEWIHELIEVENEHDYHTFNITSFEDYITI